MTFKAISCMILFEAVEKVAALEKSTYRRISRMKKSLLALTALVALNVTSVFAAPINDLSEGETAIGIGTTEYYVEHQLSDKFTIGYQNADRRYYGDMDDIYGQFRINENLRAMVGNRDLPYDSSNFYAGLAASAPLGDSMTGYISYAVGGDFKETQIGTNIAIASNIDFNVNYHAFTPDHGRNEDKFGVGATVKF